MYNRFVLYPVLSVLLISLIPLPVGMASGLLSKPKTNIIPFFVSFAAGVMLANSFFDLLPESLSGYGNSEVLMFTLAGLVFFFLMEKFFLWHSHNYNQDNSKHLPLLVTIGDTLHNFIDGVVIAGSFLVSPVIGITTSLSIALHEIPQEMADFGVLVNSGFSSKKAILLNILTGLTSVLGAVAGHMFLSIATLAVPYFMAFSAGMFIYIACSDLIPKTHEWDKKVFDIYKLIFFLLGIASIKLVSMILV